MVDELTTAAQRARVREQAALDDFARAARPDVRQTLAATVTGPEVKTADDFLKRLTDRPTLTPADRKTDGPTVGTALTARIDRMRTVEATLAGERATALATLRDDDVTRLEIVIALLGLLFLFAVGVSTAVARSLTRPLSVLRRGAERLATPEGSVEPVRFTGRNDEFAEVVRHLNAVRDQTVSLHTRIAGLDADRRRIIGRSEALAAGRDVLEEELTKLRAGLEEHRRIMSTTSVSLSLRTLGLVERQLAVIEELESKEQDPDRLATLFKLDHLATVMRRHNENLLVLAGQEHGHGQGLPVPLVDVMRAAVSEIERYERVDIAALPSCTQVAGHAADDISHVLAELLENATTFSPPEVKVKVSGWLQGAGDVVLSVVDEGIGVTEDRLEALNARLATPDAYDEEPEAEHGLGLGLYVAGRLAARHGVTAELRTPRHGGTEALVVVPAALLPDTPAVSPVHTLAMPGAPALRLPGVIAEANENTLPKRRRGTHAAPDTDVDMDVEADVEADADADADAATEAAAEAGAGAEAEDDTSAGAEAEAVTAAESLAEEPLAPVAVEPEPAPEPSPEPAVAAVPITLAEALAGPAVVAETPAQPVPADQVFVAEPPAEDEPPAGDEPSPEEQLLARVVPDAEPAAPGVPDPAEEIPAAAHTTAPVADVPGTEPEPEPHTHAPAEGNWLPRQGSHPADRAEGEGAVTDKGLPKRTPRTVPAKRTARADGPAEPPRRIDAEELRRRLGGFYQGAQDGRRVVAAELAQDQGPDHAPDQALEQPLDQGPTQRQGQSKTDRGDTAQEART
ncbi:ATP-binding protein [Streptomyces nojiriensis]|uniref:ATP-binding protein n=1 Tax=Streptomyces nojiriensis TaxID=66374 RepID=UPI00365905F3